MSGTGPLAEELSRADPESDIQEIGVQTAKRRRWLIAFAVMASAVMELVDTSAVNVSLLYIVANLSTSADEPGCWREVYSIPANGDSSIAGQKWELSID